MTSKSVGSAEESTPLLPSYSSSQGSNAEKNWTKLRLFTDAGTEFHRVETSVRRNEKDSDVPLEPAQALAPLISGSGTIRTIDGVILKPRPRPPPLPKSAPATTPSRKKARHKSNFLYNLNEYRHAYKNTRLALKLGGMIVLANESLAKMAAFSPLHHKSLMKMGKHMKRLGEGGSMRLVLKWLHPFTNTLRLSMVVLRTLECPHATRFQVGVEESMAYIGNRASHKVAKIGVDAFKDKILLPGSYFTFKEHHLLSLAWWFPIFLCIIMGIARAVAPYALSFQGSRLGRFLTKQFLLNAHRGWLPLQRVRHFNVESGQKQEEISANAPLFDLATKVALALAKVQHVGLDDGVKKQNASITEQGFQLIGFGSGGYAVYRSHIVVQCSSGDTVEPVLLHVTPYGPSILDVLPHYLVLETANSRDHRAVWSKAVASRRWPGPPMVEGFAYRGGFFAPHCFAEMKQAHDDVLQIYHRACDAVPDPRKGPESPPMDKASLEKFLNTGELKRYRTQKKNEDKDLQEQVTTITKKLESMMKHEHGCVAPQGLILYLEGLSCSRKSSIGGLIVQALNDAGFQVEQRHYNSPPTEEQDRQPWMNRFQVPDTTLPYDGGEGGEIDDNNKSKIKGECAGHRHATVVWNRGPAGDFVYGALGEASLSEKCDRYRDFMQFDHVCFKKNILFIKLLFVMNRDSMSNLIGNRLGKQKVLQDVRKWLTASYGSERANEIMQGFDMRDMSIDPTDFMAFNTHQSTLSKFTGFALNTDNNCNPWIVVDTANDFLAGTDLLDVFEAQLDAYSRVKSRETKGPSWCKRLLCPEKPVEEFASFGIDVSIHVSKIEKRMKMGFVIALSFVLIFLYFYWFHGLGLMDE